MNPIDTSQLYSCHSTLKISCKNNKCDKCRLTTIHPDFIGYHKRGYANYPICKNAITNSQYWFHIRSHPGHENDRPPRQRETTFNSRQGAGMRHSTQR